MSWGAVAGAAVGVVGGALMNKGGSSGSSTSSSSSEPWWGVQPYLTGNVQQNPDGTVTNTPGLYQDAQKLYNSGGWSPGMQGLSDAQYQALGGRQQQTGLYNQLGNDLFSGKYDAPYSPVGNISGPGRIAPSPVTAATTQAPGSMPVAGYQAAIYSPSSAGQAATASASTAGASTVGATPLSNSAQSLIAGDYNNPYLGRTIDAASRRMADNFNEQVMPGLRGQAQAAGQYGGSRQGIAEGLAAKGLSQSMSDMIGGMYSNAYNQGFGARTSLTSQQMGLDTQRALSDQASLNNMGQFNAGQQNNMGQFNANAQNSMGQFNAGQANNVGLQNAGLLNSAGRFNAGQQNNMGQFGATLGQNAQQFNANSLNNMGQFNAGQNLSAQQMNAANDMASQQFNANLGLQNNSQGLLNAQSQINNRLQGLNSLGGGNSLVDSIYAAQLGLLQNPNSYNWQNMGQYNSLLTGAAQLGGTHTQQQPYYTNPVGNALGLGTSALGLYNAGSKAGIWGNNTPSNVNNPMWDAYSGFDNPNNYG